MVTDLDKSPTTSIGYIVRNDWRWGTVVTRRSSIALLVDNTTNGAFANPVPKFRGVIAPNDVEAVLATYQKTDYVEESTMQRVGFGTSSLFTEVTLTITGTDSAPVANATLVVKDEDGTPYSFGNNGDGTYQFTLPRGKTATVVTTAPGYNENTLDITAADTALATKALTQALTETTPASKRAKSNPEEN